MNLNLYSTCPQSKHYTPETYTDEVIRVSQWSDELGFEGMLIYTDNSIVDPWLVAQLVLQNTTSLTPLLALQPAYMHPYTAAKMITSLSFLHQRRMSINFVAGGFKNDLLALGDDTPHDERYNRLGEFALIIRKLLSSSEPVSFEGRHYTITNLALKPSLPEELAPVFLMSGSSPAALATSGLIGATAIRYPQDPATEEQTELDPSLSYGFRVGIVAQADRQAAWQLARERFPEDRKGQMQHELAMKVSDSHWHKQLSEDAKQTEESTPDSPYWLHPFRNYKTFCPYLVGNYEDVGAELKRYSSIGHNTLIVDIPREKSDLQQVIDSLAAAKMAIAS